MPRALSPALISQFDNRIPFLVDGTIGVSYAPGVWHAGATVLDRRGHFAVLWPRQGSDLDEVFVTLPRPLLVGAA